MMDALFRPGIEMRLALISVCTGEVVTDVYGCCHLLRKILMYRVFMTRLVLLIKYTVLNFTRYSLYQLSVPIQVVNSVQLTTCV